MLAVRRNALVSRVCTVLHNQCFRSISLSMWLCCNFKLLCFCVFLQFINSVVQVFSILGFIVCAPKWTVHLNSFCCPPETTFNSDNIIY